LSKHGFNEYYSVVISAGFTATEYTVTEGEGVMTVGIELNIPSPQRIPLILQITPITAEGNIFCLSIDVLPSKNPVLYKCCTYKVVLGRNYYRNTTHQAFLKCFGL